MTVDASTQGRRNRRNGNDWMHDCVLYLQQHGAPNADRTTGAHSNDITGVGDVAIECTIEPWEKMWKKARQAAADAQARGLDRWVIWKKRKAQRGERAWGVGGAWAVMTVEHYWQRERAIDELERRLSALADLLAPAMREAVIAGAGAALDALAGEVEGTPPNV